MPGPIDIVGDVHGEIDALTDLMAELGYDRHGVHPRGRRLVFIGDLVDRGPESPAVIALVAGLVARGLAQCVLGNHELNLLREARKEGNGWYFADNHDLQSGKFPESRPAGPADRRAIREFLSGLPLALERSDLRLVHAAWHADSVDAVRASALDVCELYDAANLRAAGLAEDMGLAERARTEERSVGVRYDDPTARWPMLPGVAAREALLQDANPVRILTSGLEQLAQQAFFASGKWRLVNRSRWWDDYRESTPVIMGHYWRWPTVSMLEANSRGEPNLFAGFANHEWLGFGGNVFCVDFAVGARYLERIAGSSAQFQGRLAAVRWPDRELVFDDGSRHALSSRAVP